MRLIDADALKKRLKAWDTSDATDKALYNFALNRVLEAPTVDAVPVVRCRDCVNSQKDKIYGGIWCNGRMVWADHFCSCGKRKDMSAQSDNSDRCVCCGSVVPEGRMVCPICERRADK